MLIEEQDKIEKRIHSRVDFKEPISFQFHDSEGSGGCLGQDLSEGGVSINFNHFVRPKTTMALQFRLKGVSDFEKIEGQVSWAQRVPCSDRYQLGIEFANTETKSRENIRRYIESYQ